MSTLVKDRKPSPVQYIDTIENLIGHTTFYLKKLPKSDRFIWVVDLCSIVKQIGCECIKANVIKITYEQDFLERRKHLQEALGLLDTLEFYLVILMKNENFYNAITEKCNNPEYPFLHWGELIDKERKLIKAVLKTDEEKFASK